MRVPKISSLVKMANELPKSFKANYARAKFSNAQDTFERTTTNPFVIDTNFKNQLSVIKKVLKADGIHKDNIKYILSCLNKDNISIITNLVKDKTFPKYRTDEILENINKTNLKLAKQLSENESLPKDFVLDILSKTNKDNIKLAEKLHATQRFPNYHIAPTLEYTTKENIDFIDKMVANEKFSARLISAIVPHVNKCNIKLAKKFISDKNFPQGDIADTLRHISEENIAYAEKLYNSKDFPRNMIKNMIFSTKYQGEFGFLEELDLNKIGKQIKEQHALIRKNHKKYLTGYNFNFKEIENILKYSPAHLSALLSVLDKNIINKLLKKNHDQFVDYMHCTQCFQKGDFNLLKKLANSVSVDGKAFSQEQKIDFITLITAYNTNKLNKKALTEMAQTGKVDLFTLKTKLLKNAIPSPIKEKANKPKPVTKEEVINWDMQSVRILPREYTTAYGET